MDKHVAKYTEEANPKQESSKQIDKNKGRIKIEKKRKENEEIK